MSLQDKFQITVPADIEGGEKWASFSSARRPGHTTGNGQLSRDNYDATTPDTQFAKGFGGNTDPSGGVNKASLKAGFDRLSMVDEDESDDSPAKFYSEVEDDEGQVGFTERNNYLDRL